MKLLVKSPGRLAQGSIFGPLIFNIFICKLFFFISNSNIVNYADDSTPYSAKKELMNIMEI